MSVRASRSLLKPLDCYQCQQRCYGQPRNNTWRTSTIPQRRYYSESKSAAPPQSLPSRSDTPKSADLTHRSLLRLDGPDVPTFLHNLLPAHVLPLSEEQKGPIFTTLLNAKGRILHDIFLYPPSASESQGQWYIDVDANSAPALLSHLRKHKLRSKFKLEKVSPEDLTVRQEWPCADTTNTTEHRDPRPDMGRRHLASPDKGSRSTESPSWHDYMIHRMLNGHAEGPVEIIPHHALPQESNVDFCGGIDFHKGCYLGQELTIRTHHTGVVRKRILPCQIYTAENPIPTDQKEPVYDSSINIPQPPNEANISKCGAKGRSGRSTGKWLGGVGNIGLALCRLETMTDLQLTAEGSQYDPSQDEFRVTWEEGDGETDADGKTVMREVNVRAFVPEWLRKSIDDGFKARAERSKRRRQQDDEDDEDDID